jgi:putative intracellular protease/amidase
MSRWRTRPWGSARGARRLAATSGTVRVARRATWTHCYASMVARVLFPLPEVDFEPTEAAVPWRRLRDAGHEVVFATPSGRAAACDPLALRGVVFGTIGAKKQHAELYRELEADPAFRGPLTYDDIAIEDFTAVHLSGGHAPGMKAYLESEVLASRMRDAFAMDLIVSAICHGPVLLARTRDDEGRSVLHGRTVTALTKSMERSAWLLTRWTLGDHFRTYSTWVQDEVTSALGDEGRFVTGPFVPSYRRPFTVRDGNLLTGRWPGDAERLATELVDVLAEQVATHPESPTRAP